MNINIGGQLFIGVQIPILWGTRAILQDKENRLSVIDLSGTEAKLEILGNKPAPGIEYSLNIDGFTIQKNGIELYKFNPSDTLLTSISLNIPDCQVTPWAVRIGSSTFSGNVVGGASVGIFVSERGIGMGGPIPPNLAKLIV
jgi:hypothetical protein